MDNYDINLDNYYWISGSFIPNNIPSFAGFIQCQEVCVCGYEQRILNNAA